MSDTATTTDTSDPTTAEQPKAGTRPPFTEGHLTRMKFGARAPRVYGAVAERLLEDLLIAKPWLADYPEEVAAVCQQEAIVALMRIELTGMGIKDKATGQPRLALLARYFSAERAAAKARDRLGLAPLSEAVIAHERAEAVKSAVDLHALAARGQAALEARATTPDLVLATVDQVRDEYAAERADAAQRWAARDQTTAPAPQDLPALDPEAVTEQQHDREEI
jgi:hypothetical protein